MDRTMRIQLTEVREGDILLRDIFNDHGTLVLSAGTILKAKDRGLLERHMIDQLDIIERLTPQYSIDSMAEAVVERHTSKNASKEQLIHQYEAAIQHTNLIFESAAQDGMVEDEVIEQTYLPLLSQIEKERDVVSLMMLMNGEEDYTYQHSIQVSVLSFYLATWLGYSEENARRVGKAGYLHDIGKCMIDRKLINKPGALNDEEFDQIKQHTLFGQQIISNSFEDEWLSLAALQHHERMDGTGYPVGLTADRIHEVARIVAVADVYSAMISNRVYRKKQDLFSVLKEMNQMSYSLLDPHITHTFIRKMLPNFLSKRAKLSDGRVGIIIMNHHTEFFRPLIQLDQQFIDLSTNRSIEIEEIMTTA
ncbi:HD-GYP domain-containing protein [Paenibacillus aquistagni]|nr:HD-GYP domain-containing protein [Paenibacillus aquistagni]